MKKMTGYWFSGPDGLTEHQRTPIKVGDTLTVEGEIIPCEHGLHFSPTQLNALEYASGGFLWRVEASGTIVPHGEPIDKYAASKRKHLACIDAQPIMRQFAAMQALSVMHLWDAPDIVKEFIQDTAAGKSREDIRDAARGAAWGAARGAAWDAAAKQFNAMCEKALEASQP